VRDLAGFGAKSEEKLARAVQRLDAQGEVGRTPISVALPLATRIVARMLEVPGVSHAEYCGSLRRFAETVGDIDIVVVASDPGPVMDALVSMSFVERVLGRGESKTSVVSQRGTQVDLRVVAAHQLGAALLYFTGSKGPQHQAAPARARARLDAERVRALRDRGGRSSRARPRRRSTRRSACRGSRPCCARTPARSTSPRTARCRSRSAT
jgi:DNA polymerase (family 10)